MLEFMDKWGTTIIAISAVLLVINTLWTISCLCELDDKLKKHYNYLDRKLDSIYERTCLISSKISDRGMELGKLADTLESVNRQIGGLYSEMGYVEKIARYMKKKKAKKEDEEAL